MPPFQHIKSTSAVQPVRRKEIKAQANTNPDATQQHCWRAAETDQISNQSVALIISVWGKSSSYFSLGFLSSIDKLNFPATKPDQPTILTLKQSFGGLGTSQNGHKLSSLYLWFCSQEKVDTHTQTDTHIAIQRHMVSHSRHYVIAVVYTVSFHLLFPPWPRIWPSARRDGVLTCSPSRREPHRFNLTSAWAQQEAGVCGFNRYASVSFLQVLWTRSHFSQTKQVHLQWSRLWFSIAAPPSGDPDSYHLFGVYNILWEAYISGVRYCDFLHRYRTFVAN